MHDLSEHLHRLSEEIEAATRPPSAVDVRRRADQRRSRAAAGAAALSVTAVAVATPIAIGSWRSDEGRPAGQSIGSGTGTPSGVPAPFSSPSPEPSLGWDMSIQRSNQETDDYMISCMGAQGFVVGDLVAKSARGTWSHVRANGWSPEKEAAELGFSISTRLEGDTGDAVGNEAGGDDDPLSDLRPRLPGERRAVFDGALESCWTEAASDAEPLPAPEGRAIVVPSDDGSGAFTIMTIGEGGVDFEEPVRALVQSDPRIVAANDRWSACMDAAGYDAASLDALMTEIEGMTRPYREAYEAGLPAAERGHDGPNSKSLAEVLAPEQLAGLAEVQRYERTAAVASAGCDDEVNVLLPVVWQDKLDEYFGYTG